MRNSIFALCTISITAGATAQELWVDSALGVDTNPGTAAMPLKTITQSLISASAGTTVFIRKGTYSPASGELFPLQIGTTGVHNGVTLYGLEGAVIDLQNGATVTAISVGVNSNNARITGLTIQNMQRSGNEWWHKVIQAGTYNGSGAGMNFEIDRCHFKDVNRGIVLWANSPSVSTWSIHNNLFTGLGNDAINEFDPASDNKIFNNTIVGSAHLAVLSDSATSVVKNNIFSGCRVGMACANSSHALSRIQANCFYQNSVDVEGPGFPGATVPVANFPGTDPRFVNATQGDYHLLLASPLIDRGDSAVPSRADLDMVSGSVDAGLTGGTPRPDVGAYEFSPIGLTVTHLNGQLNINLTSSDPSIFVGFVLISFDDGLVKIPGWSPILVDPVTLLSAAFVGGFPLAIGGQMTAPPVGSRIIFYSGGIHAATNTLVGGRQVRLQW